MTTQHCIVRPYRQADVALSQEPVFFSDEGCTYLSDSDAHGP